MILGSAMAQDRRDRVPRRLPPPVLDLGGSVWLDVAGPMDRREEVARRSREILDSLRVARVGAS
jgi:hypothetical protein